METEYYWWKTSTETEYSLINLDKKRAYEVLRWVQEFIPAPLATEILERLPHSVRCSDKLLTEGEEETFWLSIEKREDGYSVIYTWFDYVYMDSFKKQASTLAQAATDMYIHLIKEELI